VGLFDRLLQLLVTISCMRRSARAFVCSRCFRKWEARPPAFSQSRGSRPRAMRSVLPGR